MRNDGLRMNAAMALKLAPADAVAEVMRDLITDPNSRVRLIAASYLLSVESNDSNAGEVLVGPWQTRSPGSARRQWISSSRWVMGARQFSKACRKATERTEKQQWLKALDPLNSA